MILNRADITPVNAGGLQGIWLEGYSRARVEFRAEWVSLQPGESISSFKIKWAGREITANSARFALTGPLAAGENEIICTVTGTNGESSSITFSVSAFAYAPPSAECAAERCTSAGTPQSSGAYIKASAAVRFSPCAGANSVRCSVSWRKRSESTWHEAGSFTNSGSLILGGNIGAAESCSVRIIITDSVGNSAEYITDVFSDHWPLLFNSEGSGAGLLGALPESGKVCLPAAAGIKTC